MAELFGGIINQLTGYKFKIVNMPLWSDYEVEDGWVIVGASTISRQNSRWIDNKQQIVNEEEIILLLVQSKDETVSRLKADIKNIAEKNSKLETDLRVTTALCQRKDNDLASLKHELMHEREKQDKVALDLVKVQNKLGERDVVLE